MADVTLEGFAELQVRLLSLGAKAGAVENKALRAGAEIIQTAAEKRAPRSKLPGKHLADHITVSKVKTKDGMKHVEIGPSKGDNSEYFYGKFLEWGTSKMTAHPFMGPAAVESKADVLDAIGNEVKKGIGL